MIISVRTIDILGDTFLKCVYAVFDQGNLQFGAIQRASTLSSSNSNGNGTSGSTNNGSY